MFKSVYLIFTILALITFFGCQNQVEPGQPQVNGEELVRQLWNDFKTNDREILGKWLDEGFQSVHEDGYRNRDQELELLVNLNLGEYELSDFNSTQSGNILVVTYFVSVYETIEGKLMPTDPAARMSVFKFKDNAWKWIAHANLNPMIK